MLHVAVQALGVSRAEVRPCGTALQRPDILDAGEVRQNARPNCEHHCCRESNRKCVARGAPDSAVHVGERGPDTHRSGHDQPGIRQTGEGREAWMDTLRLGLPVRFLCESQR